MIKFLTRGSLCKLLERQTPVGHRVHPQVLVIDLMRRSKTYSPASDGFEDFGLVLGSFVDPVPTTSLRSVHSGAHEP